MVVLYEPADDLPSSDQLMQSENSRQSNTQAGLRLQLQCPKLPMKFSIIITVPMKFSIAITVIFSTNAKCCFKSLITFTITIIKLIQSILSDYKITKLYIYLSTMESILGF